jgi:aminopeptidase-like protein
MIKEVYETIAKEYSGQRAKQISEHVASFHRIQASPGYRAAAKYVEELLSDLKIEFEVLKYPAEEETFFWNCSSFQESHTKEAKLFLVSKNGEQKIADYSDSKISLIQRSISTPPEGITSELVILERGDTEEEYANVDVSGKVVLASGDINIVHYLAVEKHGAIGIISDRMAEWPPVREAADLPDAISYTSFWWHPNKKKCFGFVVSPRTGLKIRTLGKKEHLKVKAFVDSRLYNGTIEVISAKINGESKKEILMTAHLCHPQPSANDNASGVGAAIESARTLDTLIKQGRLDRPKRTIHFLLVPEMTGTFAFLSSNQDRLEDFVAGINLDMVGEDQKACGSILMVDSTPLSLPTFVNAYVKHVFEYLPKDTKTLTESESLSSFRYAFVKFSGGSDHEIMSDPSVGIPTPSFTSWPDKYYHTSEDTIDKVSPKTLWCVGTVASTFAYTMANFTKEDFNFLAALTEEYCEEKIVKVYDNVFLELSNTDAVNFKENAGRQLRKWAEEKKFWKMWLTKAIEDLKRIDDKGTEEITSLYCDRFGKFVRLKDSHLTKYALSAAERLGLSQIRTESVRKGRIEKEASKMIPSRLKPGPLDVNSRSYMLGSLDFKKLMELRKRPHWRLLCYTAVCWTDGKRSLYDISEMTRRETGYSKLNELIEWFQLFEKMKFVTINYA